VLGDFRLADAGTYRRTSRETRHSWLSASHQGKVSTESASLNKRKGRKLPDSGGGDVAFSKQDFHEMSFGPRQKGARELAYSKFSKTLTRRCICPCKLLFADFLSVCVSSLTNCMIRGMILQADGWSQHGSHTCFGLSLSSCAYSSRRRSFPHWWSTFNGRYRHPFENQDLDSLLDTLAHFDFSAASIECHIDCRGPDAFPILFDFLCLLLVVYIPQFSMQSLKHLVYDTGYSHVDVIKSPSDTVSGCRVRRRVCECEPTSSVSGAGQKKTAQKIANETHWRFCQNPCIDSTHGCTEYVFPFHDHVVTILLSQKQCRISEQALRRLYHI
jgi:hypothetical protein